MCVREFRQFLVTTSFESCRAHVRSEHVGRGLNDPDFSGLPGGYGAITDPFNRVMGLPRTSKLEFPILLNNPLSKMK
jgi:hypothetical protein